MNHSQRDPQPRPPPSRLVAWWESRSVGVQIAICFPPFAVMLFVVNAAALNQPVLRSAFYGLFEGALLTGLMLVATAGERSRRQ